MSEDLRPTPRGPDPRLSWLERGLRVFTEIRPGEGHNALLMLVNVLLILCAYYLVKPLREGWLAVSGIEGLTKMELKAYSSFAQGLLLIGATAAYARLVGRWPRVVLISRTTLFCMSNLLLFWLLQPDFFFEHLPAMGIVFYLWVGMFGVFVVAQFWAFAADLYEDEQGRRLLPLIAIGATSGAVIGSWISETVVTGRLLPTEYVMLIALAPLAVSIGLTRAAAAPAQRAAPESKPGAEVAKRRSALMLVLRSRFLLAVAVATLLLNWVNTNGENVLFYVVQEALEQQSRAAGLGPDGDGLRFIRDGTTVFYGNFYFWVNLVALLMQGFLASRLLKYGGFGALFLLMPVVALVTYGAMFLVPVLGVIKAMKVVENAADYSVNNTARHVLWLPVEGDVTYRAKPTIDSLFLRLGDGLAAASVLLATRVIRPGLEGFLAASVALVLVWLAVSVWIVFAHRRLAAEGSVDVPG